MALKLFKSKKQEKFNPSPDSGVESLTDSFSNWQMDKTIHDRKDYQIVDIVGEGYFAEVFLVRARKQNGKAMVLKQTKGGRPNEQLINEINIMSQLDHPNILKMHARIRNRNDCAIFELCPDGDLAQYIQRNRRVDLDTTKRMAKELIDGVMHLHGKNILHRDIKAENILLIGDTIRIGDFGGAIILKKGQMLTTMEGSPINCAPEMIKGEGYSFPRDWWSVGVTIFQMLTGTVPFIAADQMGIFVKILVEDPVYPAFIDDQTTEFINSLLTKEPSVRAKGADLYEQEWLSGTKGKLCPLPRSSVDSGLGDHDELDY